MTTIIDKVPSKDVMIIASEITRINKLHRRITYKEVRNLILGICDTPIDDLFLIARRGGRGESYVTPSRWDGVSSRIARRVYMSHRMKGPAIYLTINRPVVTLRVGRCYLCDRLTMVRSWCMQINEGPRESDHYPKLFCPHCVTEMHGMAGLIRAVPITAGVGFSLTRRELCSYKYTEATRPYILAFSKMIVVNAIGKRKDDVEQQYMKEVFLQHVDAVKANRKVFGTGKEGRVR